MSLQRRRGFLIKYWKSTSTTNLRGDVVRRPLDGPYETTAWMIPQRSQRAEVPGQQEIDVVRIGVTASEDIDLWARVEMRGDMWDVAAPPAFHNGTLKTRHWSIDLRKRTSG